ncbi:MAG: hypothetical protein ACREKH_13425, partial [Candidatus Rokuibacteriota bacterium]
DGITGGVYVPANIRVDLSSVNLAEGAHVVSVVAYDEAGNVGTTSWSVVVDTTAPALTLFLPGDAVIFTKATTWDLQGKAPGAKTVVVSVNGNPMPAIMPGAGGEFSATLALNGDRANSISVEATDAAGNSAKASKSIYSDQTAPSFSEGPFTSAVLTNRDSVTVRGRVATELESGMTWLSINDAPTMLLADGSFAATVMLAEGANGIAVMTWDQAGNAGTKTLNATRDSEAPVLEVQPTPARTTDGSVKVKGNAKDNSGSVTVLVNGDLVVVSASGDFEKDVSIGTWSGTIVVSAQDDAGNAVSTVRSAAFVPTSAGMSYIIGGVAFVAAVMAAILGFLIGSRMGRPKEELPPPPLPPGEEMKDEIAPEGETSVETADEELPPPPPPP